MDITADLSLKTRVPVRVLYFCTSSTFYSEETCHQLSSKSLFPRTDAVGRTNSNDNSHLKCLPNYDGYNLVAVPPIGAMFSMIFVTNPNPAQAPQPSHSPFSTKAVTARKVRLLLGCPLISLPRRVNLFSAHVVLVFNRRNGKTIQKIGPERRHSFYQGRLY